jgi:hypothetical protein
MATGSFDSFELKKNKKVQKSQKSLIKEKPEMRIRPFLRYSNPMVPNHCSAEH